MEETQFKFPIIDKCIGCNKVEMVEDKLFCKVFPKPEIKWKTGGFACPMASHVKKEIVEQKKRIGQQKQKKH